MKIRIVIVIVFIFISCKKELVNQSKDLKKVSKDTLGSKEVLDNKIDTIVISKKHKTNKILCDLDGDKLNEIVEIVRGEKSGKSGLRILFGNGKRTDYFGMGNNILNQGFDQIDWAEIFERAPKDEIYWNNVNDEGDIVSVEEIKEFDKIKLLNDGIFIHAKESCGGGIIYLKNDEYEWIQQE
ncbi:hypothetical protein [Flavobacterium polysaccharolyticum]|uniref:Lipoprotein n=1 Tax=Flavobacterium polysaccharolyticum TaxID=3133148 RepID=A0ABU9NNG6_9FLAO